MELPRTLTASEVSAGDTLPPLSVDVSATTVILGALASRDWRPMHHDRDFAQKQGVQDIFLNTPTQALWFERYLIDWAGPKARPGSMEFQMRKSVCPGDRMTLTGSVESVDRDESGCAWVAVAIELQVEDELRTSCQAKIALPDDESDNPWLRRDDAWRP